MNYSEAMNAAYNLKGVRRVGWPHYDALMKSVGAGLLIYSTAKTVDRVEPISYRPSEEDKDSNDWEFANFP